MIEGKIKEYRVTEKDIYDKISEYDTYRFYFGKNFKLNKLYKSPFRNESNPSFSIYPNSIGKLKHIDYGARIYSGNCISFVMQLFNLTYPQAINRVYTDLCTERPFLANSSPVIVPRPKTLIQIIPRKFTPLECEYWHSYTIEPSELEKHKVFAVKEAYINRYLYNPNEGPMFAYVMEEDNAEYVKLYCPLAKNKHKKFKTNQPGDFIDGWHNMRDGGDIGIVAKSKKDAIILNRYFKYVCSVQSENERCISGEKLEFLTGNFKRLYFHADNDKVGNQVMNYFEKLGFNRIVSPQEKDISDYAKIYGKGKLEQFIKTII